MPPRPTALAGILALCALLGACGGGARSRASTTAARTGPSAATGATGASPPTAGPSARARREAIALARAINLRPLDLPGFRANTRHEHETATEKRLEHELLHCVGGRGAEAQIAEVSSDEFERRTGMRAEGVQSGVTVQRTPALAASELEAIRGPHVRACLTHYLDLLLAGRRTGRRGSTPVSIFQGTPPAAGATGSFAFRIHTSILARGTAIPIYFDILGFVVGPVQVTLFSDGVPRPFPAASEEKLFSLLLSRAKTHATHAT
jgi:hypothetical protein